MASSVFKTDVTRQRQVWWVRFPHSPAIASLFILVAAPLRGQQTDSARAGVTTSRRAQAERPKVVPPLSPRAAFLRSLLLPGSGQIVLGRPNAAALFGTAEVLAIGMARKSALDLREAKRGARDSVVATYVTDAAGKLVLDSLGRPKPATYERNRYTPERVNARKTHYEDWIAAILFNHLISGADAYVAANLWDLPMNMSATATPSSARISASLHW